MRECITRLPWRTAAVLASLVPVLVAAQQPAGPVPAKLVITPAARTLQAGDTLRLRADAMDYEAYSRGLLAALHQDEEHLP